MHGVECVALSDRVKIVQEDYILVVFLRKWAKRTPTEQDNTQTGPNNSNSVFHLKHNYSTILSELKFYPSILSDQFYPSFYPRCQILSVTLSVILSDTLANTKFYPSFYPTFYPTVYFIRHFIRHFIRQVSFYPLFYP